MSRICDSPPLTSPSRLMIIAHLLFKFLQRISGIFPINTALFSLFCTSLLSSLHNNLYIFHIFKLNTISYPSLYRSASVSSRLLNCDIPTLSLRLDLALSPRSCPTASTPPGPPSPPSPTGIRLASTDPNIPIPFLFLGRLS